jgi:multidrug efflux pump subunit AcrA (membrane-fusion protein)
MTHEGETPGIKRNRVRWVVITLTSALLLALLITTVTGFAGGIQALGPNLARALPAGVADRLFPVEMPGGAWLANGVIQSDQVDLASEYGGRIAALTVEDGQQVVRGQVVVHLDTSLVEAKITAARAAVALAEAGLAQARAGARPGQIAVAEAQLDQALVAQAVAGQAVSDTLALVDNPQDILLQIAVMRAQIESAGHQVDQATAFKDAAELAKNEFEAVYDEWGNIDRYRALIASGPNIDLPPEIVGALPGIVDGTYHFQDYEIVIHDGSYELYRWIEVSIPLEFQLAPNQWWQAWVGLNAADAYRAGLQASLGQLYRQYDHPVQLEAQATQAAAALVQSEAQVAAARTQLEGLEAGLPPEQIAAVEARLAQAQAALESLLAERDLLTITAPQDGLVIEVLVQPGEVVAPGATLVTIADLTNLNLTVYVPENEVGQVRPGQVVALTVDSYPDRPFEGRVVRIADQAQFTPRNITTVDERVNLVFAVDISLANPDGQLKPGMSAEVLFAASPAVIDDDVNKTGDG